MDQQSRRALSSRAYQISMAMAGPTTCFTIRAHAKQPFGISTTISSSALLTVQLFSAAGTSLRPEVQLAIRWTGASMDARIFFIMISEPTSTASKIKKGGHHARRKNWRNIGQNYGAASVTKSRRKSKNGKLLSGEWLNFGRRHQGYGNILHACPSRRHTIRRGTRRDGHQRRRDGHLDRPWRRRDEQRWDRELSGSYLFADHPRTVVATEQDRCGF